MFQIKHCFGGAVVFECKLIAEIADKTYSLQLGFAVKSAIKARASLAAADLATAYLAGADLAGANLARANLAGADLVNANLAGADLSGADLFLANLAGANLAGADLAGADLAGANLAGADLAGADLYGADLARANLAGADLSGADLFLANLARADLIDGGQRSDGYRFVGWIKGDVVQICAGCRDFTIADAREHWKTTRGDTILGDETTCILDHIERVAVIRGLIKEPTE